MIDLSIIITCFMHEQYVSRAYWSARNQKTDLDFDVAIFHDGCQLGKPSGTVGALRNRGIEQAEGKWIICLDADDVLPTNYVQTLYERAVLAGARKTFVGCPSQFISGSSYSRLWDMPDGEYTQHSLRGYALALPASTMFQREAWLDGDSIQNTGRRRYGFDEDMPVCEDLDFWCKLLSHGYSYIHSNRTCLLKNNEGPTLSHRTSDQWKEMIELVNKRYAMAMPAPEII